MTSAPVIDVLRTIRGAYRLARVAAWIGGPFGSRIGYAMHSFRGVSYTFNSHMMGHPRSRQSMSNPDGDGFWLEVMDEARALFAERERWENWRLHRTLARSSVLWWTALFVVIIAAFCFLGAENVSVGVPLAFTASGMILLSLVCSLCSNRLTEAVYQRNITVLDRASSELPSRLWPLIDAALAPGAENAVSLEKGSTT
jgi:hypothetical protein